eukprot:139017_1
MSNSSSIVPEGNNRSSSEASARAITNEDTAPSSLTGAKLRPRWTHNPLVLSILACSSMQSCDEVKQVYEECMRTHDESMICEAAEKYYKMCHMNNKNNVDDINTKISSV